MIIAYRVWAVECRASTNRGWRLAFYKDGALAVFSSRQAAWTFSRALRKHLLTRTITVQIEKF